MARVRFDARLPEGLLERVDSARGSESRTGWLVRAAESFLDGAPLRERMADLSEEMNEHVLPAIKDRPAGTYGVRISSSAAKAGVVPR